MKVVAAYLLALLGGNPSPDAKAIKHMLGSEVRIRALKPICCGMCEIGAEAEDSKISFLLSELEGKDINEVIASGREKFASVPSGGGGVVVSSGGGGGGAAVADAPAAEGEKPKEEEKEESNDDMRFSLFE